MKKSKRPAGKMSLVQQRPSGQKNPVIAGHLLRKGGGGTPFNMHFENGACLRGAGPFYPRGGYGLERGSFPDKSTSPIGQMIL